MLKLSIETLEHLRRMSQKALLSSRGDQKTAKGYLTLLDEIDAYREELDKCVSAKIILNVFEFTAWHKKIYGKSPPRSLDLLFPRIAKYLNEDVP